MSRAVLCAALLALATTAHAQTACPPEATWTFDPAEADTVAFRFVGRTLSSAGSPVVRLRQKSRADASPSAQVTAASVSADLLSLKIAPDTGCGAAGCRAGNVYQVTVQPTDSNANTPMGHACLIVRKAVYTEQP